MDKPFLTQVLAEKDRLQNFLFLAHCELNQLVSETSKLKEFEQRGKPAASVFDDWLKKLAVIIAPGVETVVVTSRSLSNDSHVLKNVVYLAIDQLNRNYASFNELIQDNIQ